MSFSQEVPIFGHLTPLLDASYSIGGRNYLDNRLWVTKISSWWNHRLVGRLEWERGGVWKGINQCLMMLGTSSSPPKTFDWKPRIKALCFQSKSHNVERLLHLANRGGLQYLLMSYFKHVSSKSREPEGTESYLLMYVLSFFSHSTLEKKKKILFTKNLKFSV